MGLASFHILNLAREPISRIGIACGILVIFLAITFALATSSSTKSVAPIKALGAYSGFLYACFLKPHTGDGSGNQQEALESFYKTQATGYDVSRARLLHGRDDLLGIVASQLKQKDFGIKRPIWVDVSPPSRFFPLDPFDTDLDWRWHRLEY
jgi:betaine lipid synthase